MSAQEANVSGRRRTPRGEQPPQATVHGLLKPSKAAPGREAGAELEVLHRVGHEERLQQIKRMVQTLLRVADASTIIEHQAREAQAVSLSSWNAEGTHSSGKSDPTTSAALRGLPDDDATPDPVRRMISDAVLLQQELDSAYLLVKSIEFRYRDVIRMHEASSDEARERYQQARAQLTGKKPEPEPEIRWCPSCAKVGLKIERGSDKEVGQDCDDCGWCHWFKRTYAREVPRSLLRLRKKRFDDGQSKPRVYEHEITQALQPQSAVG